MKIKFLRTEMDKQPLRHILNTRLQVSIQSAQMLIIEGIIQLTSLPAKAKETIMENTFAKTPFHCIIENWHRTLLLICGFDETFYMSHNTNCAAICSKQQNGSYFKTFFIASMYPFCKYCLSFSSMRVLMSSQPLQNF